MNESRQPDRGAGLLRDLRKVARPKRPEKASWTWPCILALSGTASFAWNQTLRLSVSQLFMLQTKHVGQSGA